ncbi:hypothetical protein [Novosphingobium mathurense]|nr:hypothetical protein [Novosphingobium mathurense]
MVLAICGYATILSLPAILGALARAYGFTDQQIGLIGSAELLGVTVGTLIIANQHGQQMRRWVLAAAILVGAGNLLASLHVPFAGVAFGMWLVGVGAGIVGGLAYKVGGQSSNPDRLIAWINISQLATGALGYQILRFALPAFGIEHALRGYAALALIMIAVALSTKVWRPALGDPEMPRAWSLPPRPALIVLFGFWFYCCGEVGLLAFLERIGVANGFSVDQLGNALSSFSLAGIGASLIVTVVPTSWPRWMLLLPALAFGEAAVLGVFHSATITHYAVSCASLAVFFTFTIPLILGVVSRIDPSGRSTALGLTVASTGQALGPAIAGALVTGKNYAPVGWFAGLCYALAIVSVLLFLSRWKRPLGSSQQ